VKVEYTLTPEDYVAAAQEHMQNSYRERRRAWRDIATLVVAFVSQGAILVALRLPWQLVAGILLLGLVCFVLLPPLLLKRVMAKGIRRFIPPVTSMSLEVRPDGLAVKTETTATLTIWEGIDRIAVSGTHAFFYRNDVATYILPRRAFADERDFDEFVESARSYLETAKRRSGAEQLQPDGARQYDR
jgi:hypothetical protein